MTNDIAGDQSTIHKSKKPYLLVDLLKRLAKEKPLGLVCGIIILIILITGIFADILAPYGENEVDLSTRLSTPSTEHLLGTDNIGRDVLSRIIYGCRVSVIIGFAATSSAIALSIIIGLPTGYYGGKVDVLVQRLVDAWMCFPALLILITVMSLTGRGLFQVILVLGLVFGINNSRVIRSAVISIKENIYVQAAVSVGASPMQILRRHILPNVMAPIIIIFTTSMGAVILAEASMSFLGYGVSPGTASWGAMLSWEGRLYMEYAPQLALWPGLALTITVFSMNMFGDAIRDLLDPRLRGGVGRYTTRKRKRPQIKE
jgi:peptide/nickel transport system permease protein